MKRPATPNAIQFNLPLPEAPAAELPDDKHRELARALVELLVSATRQHVGHRTQGDGNESEADA
jgi:hypothetical protein